MIRDRFFSALFMFSMMFFFSINRVEAQVEHNFEKDPENTDCHTLKPPFESDEIGIKLVQDASYRFVQDITISKYRVPNAAYYYSCDGVKGFLIVKESDKVKKLYNDIPKTLWDEFIKAKDPIGFYQSRIKSLK